MNRRHQPSKYPPILFDEARRREFIDPHMVVDLIGLKASGQVADFGAGAGFFSIPLAHALGKGGRVYAIDIDPANLTIIRGKAEAEKVSDRIELLESNVETGEGLKLKPGSLDVVVLSSVLSQFHEKEQVIALAEKLLRPGGSLVITEWHHRDMLLGPPSRLRIAKEAVINLLLRGPWAWKLSRDVDAGFYHYCLILTKDD